MVMVMRLQILLIGILLACVVPAKAGPTSIHCDGKFYLQQQPYFVTYDLETNYVMWERAGGNIVTGEIIAISGAQLEFSLRANGGRILLFFNRERKEITWPGMPADELGRPYLRHPCTEVTGRTMLSAFWQSEPFDPKRRNAVDAFSLTCQGDTGLFFITLDRVTKSVVVEAEGGSSSFAGNITGIDDGVIKFTYGMGRSHDARWDERSQSLTFIDFPDDPARSPRMKRCTVTKPRSILEAYKEWVRSGK